MGALDIGRCHLLHFQAYRAVVEKTVCLQDAEEIANG